MKVKLIQITQNPIDVMWTAARTCYSEKSPIEIWEWKYGEEPVTEESCQAVVEDHQEKHWNLVKKVLDSGHQSIAEHVYFTFAIEGISRACSHQLVRHRAGIVFSQQSQRYVEIKEDYNTINQLINNCTNENEEIAIKSNIELQDITEKYFTDNSNANCYEYGKCLLTYLERINRGQKPEDARNILPNATKTNITMSVNFRELIHICNLRLCNRAQKEIRELHKLMCDAVKEVEPRLAEYLVPNCEVHGVCFEEKTCRRKPKFEDVISIYGKYKDEIKNGNELTEDDSKRGFG